MPFKALSLKPGINTQLTRTLLGDGYSSSQLVRWMYGQPQKYGGWQRLSSTPLIGTCRGLFGFADTVGNLYLAAGTEQKLEIFSGGSLYDITPVATTSTDAATNFSTVAGSKVVTIVDVSYTPNVGDWINVVMPVSIGAAGNALVVFGQYQVQTTNPGANSYTINAASNAPSTSSAGAVPSYTSTGGSAVITVTLNSHGLVNGAPFIAHYTTVVSGPAIVAPVSTTGAGAQLTPPQSYVITLIDANTFQITVGGNAAGVATVFEGGANNAKIQYLLPNGLLVNQQSSSAGNSIYGNGPYGAGIYGGAPAVGALVSQLRQWFFSAWGQTLIANPSNGGLYFWIPPNGSTNPLAFNPPSPTANAQVITGAPLYNSLSLVIPQAQILVSFGAEQGGTQFPQLVRWSNVANYNDWTPTAINQAGSFSIPSGSHIVAAVVIGLTVLIWTDTDTWSMTYQGLPFVFDFQKISNNTEAISARSIGLIGQRVCWPSIRGFYQYDGASITPLACPVWDYFFNNVDLSQTGQVFCATNTLFTEFMWFFPFNDGSNTIGYVKFNSLEEAWDVGTLGRTAWIDHSPFGNPLGADTTGLLQQHEIGHDADGQAMVSSITTGLTAIGDGEEFMFVDAFWPDVLTQGTQPQMTITFYSANAQNDPLISYGPFPFSPSTEFVPIRVRGRLLGYTLQSADTGSFWRIGKPFLRGAGAGRR